MMVRKTTMADLPAVMAIYAQAQDYMQAHGNPNQWGHAHPPQSLIEADIQAGVSYVCTGEGDTPLAVFFFNIERDPTYTTIDGQWLDDEAPHGVVHRIARSASPAAKGTGAFCLEWCLAQHPNIRIDTHRSNAAMLALLERLGFTYCGVIRLGLWTDPEDLEDDERLAYQKITL